MGFGLLCGRDRFRHWQNFGNNGFDFPGIDQPRDLGKIFRVRFYPNPDRTNLVFFSSCGSGGPTSASMVPAFFTTG